jgi:FkbH-like protein
LHARQLYTDLAWLPRAPEDFRQQCREIASSKVFDVRRLRKLAEYALDEADLRRLAKLVGLARASGTSLAPLVPFKLGVLGNGTMEPVVPILVATALRHGILLECVAANFGQSAQEAISTDSSINRARPDAVLLAIDYRGLPISLAAGDAARARIAVDETLDLLALLRKGFRTHSQALSIVQTIAPPPEALFGNLDRRIPGTMRSLIVACNAALVESLTNSEDLLFDVAALAETVGLAAWHSPTQWNVAKLSFDAGLIPLYAEHVCRMIGALRGKARRCLVLDLDNTVWGGIVGDDGLEGIVIGQGDATGEAYLEVQRCALALRDRGVVLAVSSKNQDDVARSVFLKHPEMLLRESDIAVFQANWNDKATNIAAIAEALSLGLDAMVFVDDNPVERASIRDALPDVAVPELPEDPALYARTLAAAGYFEAITFSDEDRRRADSYQANAARATLRERVTNLEDFLRSLEMLITFGPFDAIGRSRIAQLINKSNQFNLTTRRYDDPQVTAFINDPRCFTLQVRLRDRFTDYGMIGVVICREASPSQWEIDTWLMSCRVLGRRVENAVLREVLHRARLRGISTVVGRYIPTSRNAMVSEHFATLGFTYVETGPDGATKWIIGTDAEVEAPPATVDSSAFERVHAGYARSDA